MAFISDDLDQYIAIKKDPGIGLKIIRDQQIRRKIDLLKKTSKGQNKQDKDKKQNKTQNKDDESSQGSTDEGYASDASDFVCVDIDSGGMFDHDDDDEDEDTSKSKTKTPDKDLEFQILDIDFYHTEDDNEKKQFNMMLFGKTKEDKSVAVNVENFCPFFYIEIDSRWRMPLIRKIIQDIQKKVYKKQHREGLLKYEIIQARKFHGFTDDAEINFLHLVFTDYDSMREHARALEKKHELPYVSRDRKISFKLYESNIHPILRFFHIQNIDPIGWCKIDKSKFKQIKPDQRRSVTDINVNCNWKDVVRLECTDIHKFKIMSFDIECTSEDGKFPCNRDGDKVIQISMTYSFLGEQECYKKVILCLKKTSDVQGAIVKNYNDEIQLMLAFTNEVRLNDPDIITGYNIFGFDFDYLRNRAKKFGIENQFSKLSRIKGFSCNYVEQKLESSAMGRNNLKYYNTPGRVCIDLMKYVQREHKLAAYGLDAVSANFVRDKVESFEYIREGTQTARDIQRSNNNDNDDNDKNDDEDNEENEDNEHNGNNENNNDGHNSESSEKTKQKLIDEDEFYSTDEDPNEVINENDDVHIRKKNRDNSKKKKVLYTKLKVKSTVGINKDDYIAVFYNDGPTDNRIGKKYKVMYVDDKSIIITGKVSIRNYLKRKWKVFWCMAKDDVGPSDIFRLFKGNSFDRAKVAKYCIKDSSLCNRLMAKLQILPNSIGMGNVCCVPLPYLFLRGQSVKIFSLVSKQCREERYLIPTVKKKFKKLPEKDAKGNIIETEEQREERRHEKFMKALIRDGEEDDEDDEEDEKYEGATVFEPTTGVHYEPIIVGDYSSLYPSSMIMKNLSHNSIVLDPKYDNLPGYRYHQQSYKNSDGSLTTCRFAEKLGDDPTKTKATIPRILMKLLSTRKKYNNMKEEEKDPFKKAVWDGLQLAYKVTANSLYGQCGSAVSPISMKAIAACTTSIGRDMLERARDFVEKEMRMIINLIKEAVETNNDKKFLKYMEDFYKDVPESKIIKKEIVMGSDKKPILEDGKEKVNVIYSGKQSYFAWLKKSIYALIGPYNIDPKCIYGDTDSVFFKLNMTYRETGELFRDRDALNISIKMGVIVTAILNYTFAYPQGLAYEKVYWPFVIISKKRYVGNLYVFDPNDFYQKSMGLVTKRRDNADIVKAVVGGIIDQILNKRSSIGAINFTKTILMKIITGKYNIDKYIISKTLKDKDAYVDWTRQVHVVLADRIAERDPGNKPQSNDRVPFVYVETDKVVKLQGDRVEHPQYIKQNKLKIDYMFYITNQIMKPSLQFLELIAKKPEKLFEDAIIREQNRKSGMDPINKYLKDCPTDQGNNVVLKIGGQSSTSVFGSPTPVKKSTNKKRVTRRSRVSKRIF
jgi:DNA polymerase elongation subunit (family B)